MITISLFDPVGRLVATTSNADLQIPGVSVVATQHVADDGGVWTAVAKLDLPDDDPEEHLR